MAIEWLRSIIIFTDTFEKTGPAAYFEALIGMGIATVIFTPLAFEFWRLKKFADSEWISATDKSDELASLRVTAS